MRVFALQALAPGFWKRLDKKATLSTFASGFKFTEGPVWDPHNGGFLYVSDEEQNQYFPRECRWNAHCGGQHGRSRWQHV